MFEMTPLEQVLPRRRRRRRRKSIFETALFYAIIKSISLAKVALVQSSFVKIALKVLP